MSPVEQDGVLRKAICEVWDALKETSKRYSKRDEKINFQDDFNQFQDRFQAIYSNIKAEYMRSDVIELDRHKIIAAMITTCAEIPVITYSGNSSRLISLAKYMIPVEVGLNWMLSGLNREMENRQKNYSVSRYFMPSAFACPTPYFEIFCRNLYYAKEKGTGLNPLDIAEKLFLLEYITLLKNNIDPEILCNS
jgi:hypothetical protein